MSINMNTLVRQTQPNGCAIRYKDYVVSVEHSYNANRGPHWYRPDLWQPIETEEETGVPFNELRLECITEWEAQFFRTEGEALAAVFSEIERSIAERQGF